MRSSTLSALTIAAVGINAASIARRGNIVVYTPDQGNEFFQSVITSLQTSGDLRVSFQQANPVLTAQNYGDLAQSWQNTTNLFVPGANPYSNGDFYINGTTTAAQAATFCNLIPKYAAAGGYATDTLLDTLPQNPGADEAQTIFNLGSNMLVLSGLLDFLTPLFNNSGALPACNKATQSAFFGTEASIENIAIQIAY